MTQISKIMLKDIKKAGSFDAEYFKPNYQAILNKIESYSGGCFFGELVSWTKEIEVGSAEYILKKVMTLLDSQILV